MKVPDEVRWGLWQGWGTEEPPAPVAAKLRAKATGKPPRRKPR